MEEIDKFIYQIACLNCLVMLFSPWIDSLLTVSLYNYFRPSLVYPKYMLTPSSFHFIDDYTVYHEDQFHLTDIFFLNFLPFKMFWILTNDFLFQNLFIFYYVQLFSIFIHIYSEDGSSLLFKYLFLPAHYSYVFLNPISSFMHLESLNLQFIFFWLSKIINWKIKLL